jgi:hypothetical protein
MSATHSSPRCSSCHRDTVVRPSAAWKLALVGAYVIFSAMVFGASLLGPTIMAALPLLFGAGLGLLPWLHDRAGAPAVCTACGKLQPGEAGETVEAGEAVEHAHDHAHAPALAA